MTVNEDEDQQADERKRRELEFRAAYIAGAEQRSRVLFGRPLTKEEMERLVEAYPGPPTR
jgi:hypothetical protein